MRLETVEGPGQFGRHALSNIPGCCGRAPFEQGGIAMFPKFMFRRLTVVMLVGLLSGGGLDHDIVKLPVLALVRPALV